MLDFFLILTIIAILFIYVGNKLTLIGKQKYGTLLIMIGVFQLIGELALII